MSRIAIETLVQLMNIAYRDDPFCALLRNLASVTGDEWHIKPASWNAEKFGTDPELSICDMVLHVGGAKRMYANRAFGDASLEWVDIKPPASFETEPVLAWLDEGHRELIDGLTALRDDAELVAECQAPWRVPMRREQLITIMISHDLYHSGEINRQRALIRGAEGWTRHASAILEQKS
jgi:uncharacterized damage-inducible protein DinB